MIAFCSLALEDGGLPASAEEFIQGSLNAASSLLKIISSILEFSKLSAEDADRRVPVATTSAFTMAEVAENLLDVVGAQVNDSSIDLVLSVEPSLYSAPLIGDTFRVAQAVAHIMDNAVKFSSPGGQVIVSVATRSAPPSADPADGAAPGLEGVFAGFSNLPLLIIPAGGLPSQPSGGGFPKGAQSPFAALSAAGRFPSSGDELAPELSWGKRCSGGARSSGTMTRRQSRISIGSTGPGASATSVGVKRVRRSSLAELADGADPGAAEEGTAAPLVVWVDFVVRVRGHEAT